MSHKRKEIDDVTKKVQNTRKEIDDLKAKLQELIKSGIESTKSSEFAVLNHTEKKLQQHRITFRHVANVDGTGDLKSSAHLSRKDIPPNRLQPVRSTSKSKSPDCNKKCSYDRDEARKYIKKQKEKRKELAKLCDQGNLNDAQLKRQKLKELHEKSLQLVKKNVEQKRKRSKSRETDKQTEKFAQEERKIEHQPIPDLIMTNAVDLKIKQTNTQNTNEIGEKIFEIPSNTQFVTVAGGNGRKDYEIAQNTNKIREKNSEKPSNKHLVTVTREIDGNSQELEKLLTTDQLSKKNSVQNIEKPSNITENSEEKRAAENILVVATATAETQTEQKKETTPEWLKPSALSHPYNFISTVKRKLNFAIESSPNLKLNTPKHQNLNTFQKTKEEIEKSVKSNKTINLWDLVDQNNVEHSKSESDTSKNIPNISSESSTRNKNNTHTIPDVNNTDYYPTDSDFSEPKLNTDNLKHLQVQRKTKQKSKSSTSTIKSSSSEPNLELQFGTITPDDILAFNVSPSHSFNTEKRANLQLSKKDNSSIKTDTFSSKNLTVPTLHHPDVTIYPQEEQAMKTTSVISLKNNGEKTTINTKGYCNEIHLKIEAELHHINDVNESLKKFMDLEKSLLELREKHMQNPKPLPENRENEIQTINYSRGGSDVSDVVNFYSLSSSDFELDKGILATGLDCSIDTKESCIDEQSIVVDESLLKEPFIGVSLGTFEQLIKDEDRRLENLKINLKLREKTLLDRTKTELVLLEIQRKHLKETGQLHEASLLKKKQRGILMRMQHEHHEMQRLKQMQNTASRERKADLKQKRNMIKAQLSTNKMLTKTKLNNSSNNNRENQRQSGPFKVYNIQSHSESVRSETSISRNSITDEVISVTSHSRSVVNRVSDVEVTSSKNDDGKSGDSVKEDHLRKILLMREAALQKRRKAAEEVLQWHKQLSEEEKKVAELEMVAKSIIHDKGSGDILQKMTKHDGTLLIQRNNSKDIQKFKSDKFSEKDSSYDSINTDVDYSSDVSSAMKTDVLIPEESVGKYTSDFETPTSLYKSSEKLKSNDKIASITELIDSLTKINEENSILSKRSSLNKSIDAEIDKLANIYSDTNSNSSQSKSFQVETNKLLNLKEHLHLDNSKAILDSIESLKSSIKEITSKAERSNRSSRRCSSETQSTDKDVSEISDENEGKSESEVKTPISEQESSHEERSQVTVEENKTCLIETEGNNLLTASSPFIENKCESVGVEEEKLNLETEKIPTNVNVIPQYEDISDVSEHNVSVNADSTLNELSNNELLSYDHDDKAAVDDDKALQEDEGISEETLPVESISEVPSENKIDVKKRVSEIMADANISTSKSDRSPRLQDLYITTYDLISPESSPESNSPLDSSNVLLSSKCSYDAEAELLLKKQLEIEQEIKQIQQQQHIPYLLIREIPNKPPPPYTPPVAAPVPVIPTILPSTIDQIVTACKFSAGILYNAHLTNNLESLAFENQTINDSLGIEKGCLKFLFDICKDLAVEHYEKFKIDKGPSWIKVVNKQKLSLNTPFNKTELEKYLNQKLKNLFGYEKVERRENAIIRWSRKKRDHVDEILVLESQAEETEWTNYDKDELLVKNDVTNEIMNMLLSETADLFSSILKKKCESS